MALPARKSFARWLEGRCETITPDLRNDEVKWLLRLLDRHHRKVEIELGSSRQEDNDVTIPATP